MKQNILFFAIVAVVATIGILTGPAHAAPEDIATRLTDAGPAFVLGGLILNAANLSNLFVGFKTSFQQGLGMAQPQWQRIATLVPSSTSEEKFGWLGQLPNVREWLGDRVKHGIATHDYAIKNKDWELTIAVPKPKIEDDTYGIYSPMFVEMGRSVAAHPDMLCYALLKLGFATLCYDGQNFFDTDHPVLDENGVETSVANTDEGAGTPWFLIDTSRALKPVIFQERKPFQFVAKNRLEDDNVFERNEFVYGSDGRDNVGFGFWQFAWGSKQTLDADHYETARAAISGMKGDYGRPLGLTPNLLVVPPALEGLARDLLTSERTVAGATNKWRGTAELLVVPWLA